VKRYEGEHIGVTYDTGAVPSRSCRCGRQRTSPIATAAGRVGDGSTSQAAEDDRRFHLCRSLASGVLAVGACGLGCGTIDAGPMTTRPSPMTSISVCGAHTAIS